MVWMGIDQALTKRTLDRRSLGRPGLPVETQDAKRPTNRVGERVASESRAPVREVHEERGPRSPFQECRDAPRRTARRAGSRLRGINRSQHHLPGPLVIGERR